MTAAFDQRDEDIHSGPDTLFTLACYQFGCEERSLGRFDLNAARRDPERTKKRRRIKTTLDKFRSVMSGPNPPQTKKEAVEAIAPLLTLLLSVLFKQFAIMVIEWLWEQSQQQETRG